MTRITYSAPCGSNTMGAQKWVEQDGSGALKQFDGTGTPRGYTLAAKDSNNNVGVQTQGLALCPVAGSATFNVGAALEVTTSGVQAYVTGLKIGFAAETTTIVTSAELLVMINIDNA